MIEASGEVISFIRFVLLFPWLTLLLTSIFLRSRLASRFFFGLFHSLLDLLLVLSLIIINLSRGVRFELVVRPSPQLIRLACTLRHLRCLASFPNSCYIYRSLLIMLSIVLLLIWIELVSVIVVDISFQLIYS
jgi:hypothetical protein